jgi:hypothetical protein
VFPWASPRNNRKSLRLITAPTVEPVALSEVKAFLRVDTTAEDDVINIMLKGARRLCEECTQRAFITQTWQLTLDAFYSCDNDLPFSGTVILPTNYANGSGGDIDLSRLPVQSIVSIKTYAADNSVSTVDPSVYRLDDAGGRIVLNDGQSWPSNLRQSGAVVITFICGYGDDGTKVPETIILAIIQQTSAMYEDRKCSDLQPGVKTDLVPFMTAAALTRW